MTEHALNPKDKFVFREMVIASVSEIKRSLMGIAIQAYDFIVTIK